MRDLRIPLMGLLMLAMAGLCPAADRFSNPERRQAFLRALGRVDAQYDPAVQMLRGEFSSPGYHTTLTGGTVHRTRESLEYAVALLDSDEPSRLPRAEAILRRVIGLQDQDPNSPTYGIWPWFLEEPLERMSPPDWNWADFCGVQLLQVVVDHMDRLAEDLRQKVRDSVLHAARSIRRRDVGPGYTNIALMGTYVTLVAGERLDDRGLFTYGKERLKKFYDYTEQTGSFTEYNSPTYTCVAIEEISRMIRHVRDEASQELLTSLNRFAWYHVACRFHAQSKQWSGPHSRSYSTLLSPETLAFLQRGVSEDIKLVPQDRAWESLDAHRLGIACPTDHLSGFRDIVIPRTETEAFVHTHTNDSDTIGRTWLHPDFSLGSVNISDLWNQRRPLVGYWQTSVGPAAVRIRCLHDGYDYASATLLTVQDKGDVLGAVLFATDRGDTHISLDKIAGATIQARDLRVRLQFEGAVGGLTLPDRAELNEPIRFASGPIEGVFGLHSAEFAEQSPHIEIGRDAEGEWIDLVLYHGSGRPFDFSRIEEAAVVFTLSLATKGMTSLDIDPSVHSSIESEMTIAGILSPRQKWIRQRRNAETLSLTIPTRPLTTKEQIAASAGRVGEANPWKVNDL